MLFHWQVWDLFGYYIAAHSYFHWIFIHTGQQGFQNQMSKMFAMSVITLPIWAVSRPPEHLQAALKTSLYLYGHVKT